MTANRNQCLTNLQRGAAVIGVDSSEAMIEAAKRPNSEKT
jgi:trans-aconitate methyltransferase